MITAIIIDDEKQSRKVIKRLIQECNLEVIILNEASSVEEGFQVINKELPQLVFLDVEMLDGTGFNLLEKFKEIEFEVIFTTAYNKYAIKAFRYSAIDYLLKPISSKELEEAILKAKNLVDRKLYDNSRVKLLLDNVKKEDKDKKIVIKSAIDIGFIAPHEIICCCAEGTYTQIILLDDKTIMASNSLKYFDEMFSDHIDFFRISKSCLINLNFVKSLNKVKEVVVLENGLEVKIARRKKQEFLGMMLNK